MSSRYFGLVTLVVLLGLATSGCVNRPTSTPVGEGGAAAVALPPTTESASLSAPLVETLTPLPQAAEAHPAPDDTPGVDKAESDVATNPKDFRANLRLAFSYYKSKAFAQAAPQFVQTAQLDPKNATPRLYLGYTQMAVGALTGAQATFTDVTKIQGIDAKNAGEANLQIGNILWAQNKSKEAASAFKNALILNPREGKASLALGTWAAQQKQTAQAKKYFSDAVRDLPTQKGRAQAYACLGRLAQDAKNTNEARANYQKALQLDTDNEWAKRALAALKKG